MQCFRIGSQKGSAFYWVYYATILYCKGIYPYHLAPISVFFHCFSCKYIGSSIKGVIIIIKVFVLNIFCHKVCYFAITCKKLSLVREIDMPQLP